VARHDAVQDSLGVRPTQSMRNVHQLRSHEVEARRRLPEESVPDEDPLTPVWNPLPSQFRQLFGDIENLFSALVSKDQRWLDGSSCKLRTIGT
jgi:hypothetical protein